MSAIVQANAAPETGWRLEFKHAGHWYFNASCRDFFAAWHALSLLHKLDADQPVERRIVKSFD